MPLPGLEILFQSLSRVLKGADDSLVSAIHWKLITNGFKCVGKGEKATSKNSEVLPTNWNENQDVYILRYIQVSDNQYFLLKIIKIDESLMVNFMREEDEKVASTTIRISDYSTGDTQDYHSAFKNLEEFKKKLKKEILDEFKPADKTSGKKSKSSNQKSVLLEDDPHHGQGTSSHRRPHQPDWVDPDGPFSIGRGDLDPLAGGGGGMLMDPRRSGPNLGYDPSTGLPSRLPRGAVPPGARFDPFGPTGARPSPDPDHMRPPDYDDMFM